MKAVLYNKKGSPDKLVFTDVEKPYPRDNEVLIKIMAVSVNAADYRSFKMGLIPKKKIFGADISGTVEAVGKNIQKFKPGDEVIGELSDYGFGGFAEYAVAPEKLIVKKPAGITFEEASALPMASVTALQALRNKGNIRKGSNVLILGSGGGVGTFAIQLAKYFGATVTAVCSTRNVEQSLNLGADNVIDYTRDNVADTPQKYDIIVAINGNYSLLACKKLLKPNGSYVAVGGALSQIIKPMIFGKLLSLGSGKIKFLAAKPLNADLEFIADLAGAGVIKPVIYRRYSLNEVPDAVRYIGEGHTSGKIVIKVGSPGGLTEV